MPNVIPDPFLGTVSGELIGTLRLSDLLETARYSLGLHGLRETQVLDTGLADSSA